MLLAGEPGVGKSTLLLDVAARAARSGVPTLYVTGEESVAQVRLRADRISAVNSKLWIAAETDLAAVLGTDRGSLPRAAHPRLSPDGELRRHRGSRGWRDSGPRGCPDHHQGGQVDRDLGGARRVTSPKMAGWPGHGCLSTWSTSCSRSTGTVTTRCGWCGHQEPVRTHRRGRLLRTGRVRHPRPARPQWPVCLPPRRRGSGTCVTVALEGRRPLVCEVQALVAPGLINTNPRRTNSGVDPARTAMMLAVFARRARLSFSAHEVYAATVGGVKLRETAADLAIALALSSAMLDRPFPRSLVAVGEIGLAGEVRPVAGIERRLAEASRLGFTMLLLRRLKAVLQSR